MKRHFTSKSLHPCRLVNLPIQPLCAQRLPPWCNSKFMQSLCSVNQARQCSPPVWNVSTWGPNQSRLGWHKCNSSRKARERRQQTPWKHHTSQSQRQSGASESPLSAARQEARAQCQNRRHGHCSLHKEKNTLYHVHGNTMRATKRSCLLQGFTHTCIIRAPDPLLYCDKQAHQILWLSAMLKQKTQLTQLHMAKASVSFTKAVDSQER